MNFERCEESNTSGERMDQSFKFQISFQLLTLSAKSNMNIEDKREKEDGPIQRHKTRSTGWSWV